MAEIKVHTIVSKLRIRTVREDTWDLDDMVILRDGITRTRVEYGL